MFRQKRRGKLTSIAGYSALCRSSIAIKDGRDHTGGDEKIRKRGDRETYKYGEYGMKERSERKWN